MKTTTNNNDDNNNNNNNNNTKGTEWMKRNTDEDRKREREREGQRKNRMNLLAGGWEVSFFSNGTRE